jgi:hypothetical protein
VGLFQVKRALPDGFVAENLINEVDYTIKPTTIPQKLEQLAKPGAFFRARIIPVRVAQLQMQNPQFAFRDNEEKIRQGFELQKKDRELFIEYFGSDEVLTEGRKLPTLAGEFMSKYPPAKPGALRLLAPQRGLTAIGQNQNQEPFITSSGFRVAFHLPGMTILLPELSNSGSPPAEPGVYLDANYRLSKREKPLPEGYEPPEMSFPRELLRSKDVGIVFDELSGQHYLVNYGIILNVFRSPDEVKIQRYKKDIMTYLEDQTISPNVLKRLFFKFPENTEAIIRKILDRPEFDLEKDFNSLMDEFKPSFKGKRIYPYILPMSHKLVEAMRSEPNPGKGNGKGVGRNDPCLYGSGKKYKKCCGR